VLRDESSASLLHVLQGKQVRQEYKTVPMSHATCMCKGWALSALAPRPTVAQQ
jgi:hypothetical protein